ncbi:hypothetical protein MY10362_006986 [Beauveria mimosiformis]
MAPVQTFSSSPIVAAKAPTATTHSPTTSKTAPATATAAPSSSSSYSSPSHGQTPPAQPAARPSIPAATSSGSSFPPRGATGHAAAMLPTPTQPLISDSNSPPAPQPGAVPIPPGAAAAAAAAASTSSTLPPPPKSGETLGPEHTGAAGQPPRALPAQLSYPPPTASHTSLRGTSAAIPSPYEVGGVGGGGGGSVQLLPGIAGAGAGGINRATDLSHPPGYQQDAQAAEFSSGQRAAHEAYVAQHSNRLTSGLGMGMGIGAGGEGGGEAGAGDGEGTIWNTAKKWASAAGDTLAAAEGEVWKAVNKDHK